MAVLIKDFDKPVSCEWVDDKNHLHRCLFLNGDDDCILHHCPDEWSWNEQYDACPLAEGKENVRGEWIEVDAILQKEKDLIKGNKRYTCSVCGASDTHAIHKEVLYCWFCGADMRGEDNATT